MSRKLYVGSEDGMFGVVVIDCATDSVIARFDSILSDPYKYPAYCERENKVYWLTSTLTPNRTDSINIIDCAADSVIRRIPVPAGEVVDYCSYAPWSNRLYVASSSGISPSFLSVLDCRSDSVIGQTRFGKAAKEIVCNPADHRIYVSDFWDSAVYVFREDLQSVEEEPTPARRWAWLPPAVIGGTILVPAPRPGVAVPRIMLFDALGSKVADLAPGRNRLARTAAGVYYFRLEAGSDRLVAKTILVR